VNGIIHYLNTDLDLSSPDDLTALAAILESQGVFPLHVTCVIEGVWHATFETNESYTEPEPNIAAMVAVVEALDEPHRPVWLGCTRRQFNIGYDCGDEPWEFNQGLSCELLGRIAAVGASIRITLYPDREPSN
jgi:hypothetical protein